MQCDNNSEVIIKGCKGSKYPHKNKCVDTGKHISKQFFGTRIGKATTPASILNISASVFNRRTTRYN